MNEFKPHDYFKADDQGYISRKLFIEHVRNTYDHMRELASLIKGYDQTIDTYLERWDQNLESLDDSIIGLLKEWIDDSTFATIINEEIFKTKADQVDLENVTAQLRQTEQELSSQLAEKINKGEVTQNDLNKNTFGLDGTWFSTDFLQALNGGTLNTTSVLDRSLTTQKYVDKSVTREKVSEFGESINLFDKTKAVIGKVSDESGNIINNATWSYYVYYPKPSQTYTFYQVASTYLIVFDTNGNRIATPTGVIGPLTVEYTMPSNVGKIYANVRIDLLDTYMLLEGSVTPTEYVPYYTTFDSLKLKDGSVQVKHLSPSVQSQLGIDLNKWDSKSGVSFGDSIEWYDGRAFLSTHFESGQTAKGYQSYMRETLNMTIDNQGVSGYNAKQIYNRIVSYDFSGKDVVTIKSGPNDWTQQRVIGAVALPQAEFNVETYCGALQKSVEHILNANNKIKIVLITPPRGYHPQSVHSGEWTTKGRVVDGAIEMPNDYAKATKDIAELYGLDVIDFYAMTNLNFLTKSLYLGDDPSLSSGKLVHPNNLYYKVLGNYAVDRFLSISPL